MGAAAMPHANRILLRIIHLALQRDASQVKKVSKGNFDLL